MGATVAVQGARENNLQNISDVIAIDQTPIGRTPRSNPATYIGFYDDIRRLFADTPGALARGYAAGWFSFNVKGGLCEECGGEGIVTTSLHFMPDVETPCQTCMGARYNEDTLEVTWRNKNIAQVLDLSIEEGVSKEFLAEENPVANRSDGAFLM